MEENTNGIPDVDLSPILDDLKEETPQEPKQEDRKTETTEELDLGQFKNPKDLLKSYKEIQAAFTRVTQENKTAKQKEADLMEQMAMLRSSVTQPAASQSPGKKFDEAFMENPELAITEHINRTVMTTRIAEVLEEEADKNRNDFQERYAYAQAVAREYPNLATTPQGVRKLFLHGDKLRTDQLKKNAGKALESIFGEPLNDEQITRLRTLVKGDKQTGKQNTNSLDAYMPDTSTSTRSGAEFDQKPNKQAQIQDAVKKGDVDGVLDTLIKGVLAE